MATFQGATAAIEQRLTDNWTTTPIAFENETAPTVYVAGALVPWVFCEVATDDAEIIGVGQPGNHVNRVTGDIVVTVFVPVESKRATARTHAETIGNIFRTKEFYNSDPGACVRTWAPQVMGGREAKTENPDGNWWAVAVSIPFEFYHLA